VHYHDDPFLNCGRSSIKYQLFNMSDSSEVLAKGLIERIGIVDGVLTHKPAGKDPYKVVLDIPDHTVGINMVMEALVHPDHGVIKSINEIKAVGHRVAHGGENFKESVLINADVKRDIEKCGELAPLHNPAHLKGILSCEKLLPAYPRWLSLIPRSTRTMPDYAYMYAIPYEYCEA
jgi:acetate kinase